MQNLSVLQNERIMPIKDLLIAIVQRLKHGLINQVILIFRLFIFSLPKALIKPMQAIQHANFVEIRYIRIIVSIVD